VEIPSVEESVVVGSGFESVNVSVGSSVDGSLVSVQFPLGCTVAVAAGSGIDVEVAASVPVTAFESVRVGTLESFVDVASGTVELSVDVVGAVSFGNSVVVTSSPG